MNNNSNPILIFKQKNLLYSEKKGAFAMSLDFLNRKQNRSIYSQPPQIVARSLATGDQIYILLIISLFWNNLFYCLALLHSLFPKRNNHWNQSQSHGYFVL